MAEIASYFIYRKLRIPPLNVVIVISVVWIGGRECQPALKIFADAVSVA